MKEVSRLEASIEGDRSEEECVEKLIREHLKKTNYPNLRIVIDSIQDREQLATEALIGMNPVESYYTFSAPGGFTGAISVGNTVVTEDRLFCNDTPLVDNPPYVVAPVFYLMRDGKMLLRHGRRRFILLPDDVNQEFVEEK